MFAIDHSNQFTHTGTQTKRNMHKGKGMKNSLQVTVTGSCGLPWYSQWVRVEPWGAVVSAQALSAFGDGSLSIINLRVCELWGILLRGRCWCIPPFFRGSQRASLRTVCRMMKFFTLVTCKISMLKLVTGVAKTHASAHTIVRRHKVLDILHMRKKKKKFSSRLLTSKDVKNLHGAGMMNNKGMWASCLNQHPQPYWDASYPNVS